MWMPNQNGEQSPAEGEPLPDTRTSLRRLFANVYRFILQAVNGDRATADALLEDYLDGKLSEPLLAISRDWVSADQTGLRLSNRNLEGGGCRERGGALEVNDNALPTAA